MKLILAPAPPCGYWPYLPTGASAPPARSHPLHPHSLFRLPLHCWSPLGLHYDSAHSQIIQSANLGERSQFWLQSSNKVAWFLLAFFLCARLIWSNINKLRRWPCLRAGSSLWHIYIFQELPNCKMIWQLSALLPNSWAGHYSLSFFDSEIYPNIGRYLPMYWAIRDMGSCSFNKNCIWIPVRALKSTNSKLLLSFEFPRPPDISGCWLFRVWCKCAMPTLATCEQCPFSPFLHLTSEWVSHLEWEAYYDTNMFVKGGK